MYRKGCYCEEKGTTEDTQELKFFMRYVDDIVCTVQEKKHIEFPLCY